jgi:hypothetical protein
MADEQPNLAALLAERRMLNDLMAEHPRHRTEANYARRYAIDKAVARRTSRKSDTPQSGLETQGAEPNYP